MYVCREGSVCPGKAFLRNWPFRVQPMVSVLEPHTEQVLGALATGVPPRSPCSLLLISQFKYLILRVALTDVHLLSQDEFPSVVILHLPVKPWPCWKCKVRTCHLCYPGPSPPWVNACCRVDRWSLRENRDDMFCIVSVGNWVCVMRRFKLGLYKDKPSLGRSGLLTQWSLVLKAHDFVSWDSADWFSFTLIKAEIFI